MLWVAVMRVTSDSTVWNVTTQQQTLGHLQHPWPLVAAVRVCWHAVYCMWLVEWAMLECHLTLESILTPWQTRGGQLPPCITSEQAHQEQQQMERSTSLVSHVYLVCKSDRHLISPNSITPESNIKVMRVTEMITNSRSSWLLDKFSL